MPRIVSTVALVVTLVPLAARAQGVPAAVSTVPAPLVTALIGAANGSVDPNASYFVGELPPGWPASAKVPSNATIIGGMASRGGRIAIFEGGDPKMLAEFDSSFASNGWVHPKLRLYEFGFQSDPLSASYFCRDSSSLFVNPAASASGHRFIQVRYQPPSANSSCTNTEKPVVTPGMLVLPRLLAPKGSSSSGGAGHGGSDDVLASAAIRSTTLTPRQLLDHYATQLTAAGWTASPAAFTERGAVQPFDARDSTGAPWAGALIVTSRGKTLEAILRMYRDKP